MLGRFREHWITRGFTKLNFTAGDFEGGELRPDIPLNAVDRHVGRRMRERRIYLKMSEARLAEIIGVGSSDIWAFEEGKARIGFDDLLAVGAALRVSEPYFYKGFGFSPTLTFAFEAT